MRYAPLRGGGSRPSSIRRKRKCSGGKPLRATASSYARAVSSARRRSSTPGLLRDLGPPGDSRAHVLLVLAQVDRRRERLATHCLSLAGHVVYQPRIRSPRRTSEALFPTYTFVTVELQWHTVRWAPGVVALLMNGNGPARVADHIID